jgi:dTDP-4-dehydrorhamnose 3,5-epimerase
MLQNNIRKFEDERGKMLFPIDENIHFLFKQCTISINKKNVFRGLHINNFDKLVTCIQGEIYDVIVDLNINSNDYLIPKYYNLKYDTDLNQIFIPKGFAHGFLSLEDNSIIVYHFSNIFKSDETIHINYLDPFINIKLPIINNNVILSDNDKKLNFVKKIDYIVLGGNGFLGSNIIKILKLQDKNVLKMDIRLENIEELNDKIKLYKPSYIINAAGLTGSPNTKWCDDNKEKTIETNITFQLTLCKICNDLNIHLTIFGSGGIFLPSNNIKLENEKGDNSDTFYSACRINLENILFSYKNILYLRINYPLSYDSNDKNLLNKLIKYNIIEDKKMSITCIDTLFPILPKMIENNEVGICNFVNPGFINLSEIIKYYYEYNSIVKNIIIQNNKLGLMLDTTRIYKYTQESINVSVQKCIQLFKN